MHQSRTRLSEEEDRTRDAIGHLAEIARSAAVQKEHDAKMLTITEGSVTAVRQLLEAEARRSRLFGRVALGAGTAVALAAVSIAFFTAHSSRNSERNYQRRLLEESSKRLSLESDIATQKVLAETLREEQRRDRDALQNVQGQLSKAQDQLDAAQAELTTVKRGRDDDAEEVRLAGKFATRQEQQQQRDLLHIMLWELLDVRERFASALATETGRHEQDELTAETSPVASKPVVLSVASATTPSLPPSAGLSNCDADTHECFLTSSGMCSTP